jgi:CBS domain-containing protein
MHCKEIMTHDVQWIQPDKTVAGAAKLMAFHNLGFLPICSPDGKPLGVITDRDIALRVMGNDRSAAHTRVAEVMTASVRSVAPDCPVDLAGALMTEAGISQLLVLDEGGQLEGVIGMADLMAHAPDHIAMKTARGIFARETSRRSAGSPRQASKPTPKFFRGKRDLSPSDDSNAQNLSRIEAGRVVSGGTNELKEFPS